MTCDICRAPAHYVYADGDLLMGFCAICDRIGAEDQPMESTWSVIAGGVAMVVLILAVAIVCGVA